jgi:uncharacterized protein
VLGFREGPVPATYTYLAIFAEVDPALKIKTARSSERLTQSELAKRAGTTQSAIAAYESGSRRPSTTTLARLLDASGFRPSHIVDARSAEIRRIAARYRGHDVRVFGSIGRDEDTATSDIDLLIRFDRGTSLLDLSALEYELTELLGIEVDVVSEGGLRLPKHQSIVDAARSL